MSDSGVYPQSKVPAARFESDSRWIFIRI
jgi:hypothetical protein